MNTKIYSFNQERDQGWSVVFDATENLVRDVPLARALQSVIMLSPGEDPPVGSMTGAIELLEGLQAPVRSSDIHYI